MIWGIGWILVLGVAVRLWVFAVTFWRVTAVLLVAGFTMLWIAYSPWRPAAGIRALLTREVSLPARGDPPDLYTRPSPPRLSWNWGALILGPFWYLFQGLWVHGVILLVLTFVSGGLLAPLAWLYAALKADEDLLEFRIARKSVY